MTRTRAALIAGIIVLSVPGPAGQTAGEAGRDWAYPLGDAGATRYSTLTQINASNVQNLTRAWTFSNAGRFAYPAMVVDSVVYFAAPNGVFAVDGVTGKQLWRYPAGSATPPAPPAPAPPAAGAPAGGRGGRGGGADGAGTAVRG